MQQFAPLQQRPYHLGEMREMLGISKGFSRDLARFEPDDDFDVLIAPEYLFLLEVVVLVLRHEWYTDKETAKLMGLSRFERMVKIGAVDYVYFDRHFYYRKKDIEVYMESVRPPAERVQNALRRNIINRMGHDFEEAVIEATLALIPPEALAFLEAHVDGATIPDFVPIIGLSRSNLDQYIKSGKLKVEKRMVGNRERNFIPLGETAKFILYKYCWTKTIRLYQATRKSKFIINRYARAGVFGPWTEDLKGDLAVLTGIAQNLDLFLELYAARVAEARSNTDHHAEREEDDLTANQLYDICGITVNYFLFHHNEGHLAGKRKGRFVMFKPQAVLDFIDRFIERAEEVNQQKLVVLRSFLLNASN